MFTTILKSRSVAVLAISAGTLFAPVSASAQPFPDTGDVARAQILGTWRGETVTSAAVAAGANLENAERARHQILGKSLPSTPVRLLGLAQARLDHQELARRQILGISSASRPEEGAVAFAR